MNERVEVDLARCIGCGTCWVSVPKVFRETEDYLAEPTGELGDPVAVRAAIAACPTFAITLFGDGGLVLYPTAEMLNQRASAEWA